MKEGFVEGMAKSLEIWDSVEDMVGERNSKSSNLHEETGEGASMVARVALEWGGERGDLKAWQRRQDSFSLPWPSEVGFRQLGVCGVQ